MLVNEFVSLRRTYPIIMNKVYLVLIGLALIASCTRDKMPSDIDLDNTLKRMITNASPESRLDYYILPDETDYEKIPQDPKNPLTKEKIELGKLLFHETALAQDAVKESGLGTYSCASCHIAESGFRPNNFQGIADGGLGFGANGEDRVKNIEYTEGELDVQSARPLSMVNVAYVRNTFWNGQFGWGGVNEGTEDVWNDREDTERNHQEFHGIETQNFEGLISHRISINKELLEEHGYLDMYDEVFGDIPEEERYTIRTASFAFSAYIRSILSNKAPFQLWLKGEESALSYEEKKGAQLFFGKANCSNCHFAPNLGSSEFHALGVKDMYQQPSYNTSEDDRRNKGRGGFTGKEEDLYKFKVPGLYNIGKTNYFFHGASAYSLKDVVDYKIAAQSENPNVDQSRISEKFVPLELSTEERNQLLQFLRNGLEDPFIARYKPTSILSGNCFPNNDTQSKIELGCD